MMRCCAKLASGANCDKDAEYTSGGCNLGICALLPSFAPCATNAQCVSGLCNA